MEKKKAKLGLLPKLVIAIVLGIIIGQFFPVWFSRGRYRIWNLQLVPEVHHPSDDRGLCYHGYR